MSMRLIGLVIAACGLALCHGATQLWPADADASQVVAALRIVAAALVAVLGVLNFGAGMIILLLKPARE